ncbi:MAG: Asp23/Gls24 family envelope stress response protein [Erysipelothrix sp.]|nr:Asp23/Gls24 family envelope stress response protein [Erysipelothrix sp.]
MAHEYFRSEASKLGSVHITYSVIEHIARIGIEEIEGFVVVDGSFRKGINATVEKGLTKIDIDIKVKYGFNADRIARQIQDRVVRDVRQMADVVVEKVNVNVLGFHFE